MRNGKQFTMIAPSTGFTSRVMARIVERERVQARRRALIGSVLLVGAAIAILAFIAWWLAGWVSAFLTTPSVIVSVLNAFTTLAVRTNKFLGMLWTVVMVIAQNIGAAQMLSLAVGVFALTLVWVRVVTGHFQFASITNLGGLAK